MTIKATELEARKVISSDSEDADSASEDFVGSVKYNTPTWLSKKVASVTF